MIARVFIAGALLLLPQMAGAAPSKALAFSIPDTDSLAQTLTRASVPALLGWSCGRLVTSLMQESADGSPPSRDAQRDESFSAIAAFLKNGRDAGERVACARRLYGVRYPLRDLSTGHTISSAYGDAADQVVLAMLSDPLAAIREGAAGALWNSTLPQDARALLKRAESDSEPAVVAACFQNLDSPMRADVAANHDGAAYDVAIAAALRSPSDVIVGGALHAYVARQGAAADATLRRFALDPRPVVRRAAIEAYAGFPIVADEVAQFIESRLSDPNPDVRLAVYDRLYELGDHRALPAIERLERTAPSQAQRQAARDAATSIRTEASFSFR